MILTWHAYNWCVTVAFSIIGWCKEPNHRLPISSKLVFARQGHACNLEVQIVEINNLETGVRCREVTWKPMLGTGMLVYLGQVL